MSAFFVPGRPGPGWLAMLLALAWAAPAAALCPADRIDEQVRVRHANDGDTVELSDGRRLRLVGINTPELGRDRRPDEPLAGPARAALLDLVRGSGHQLSLRYGPEREDRYGRVLAQAYLRDGRNLGALLVARGLAHAIVVPPNGLDAIDCLARAEQAARRKGLGIWRVSRFSGEPSASLSPPLTGFRLVEGRVRQVERSRRSVWLNLEGDFAVRIARKDLIHFRQPAPDALRGQRIRVRGWVRRQDGRAQMQLRHPAMLERLD